MSDDIVIVSSTDTPEQVQSALTGTPVPETPAAATPPAAAPPAAAGDPPPADDSVAPPNETAEQKVARESRLSAKDKRLAKIKSQIDEETTRKYNARREADAEEARLRELRREREQLEGAAKPPAPPAAAPQEPEAIAGVGPKPKLDDVNADGTPTHANYEAWVDALNRWHVAGSEARILKAQRDAERQSIADAEAARVGQTAFAAYNEHLEAFKVRTPDFDAVMEEAKPEILELLEEAPNALDIVDQFTVHDALNGPAVEHYLATNTDELRRITALPVARQLIELARLDARFQAAAPPAPAQPRKTPPVTKAPAPIVPVGATPTASTVSADDEDYRSYTARREADLKARGLPVR